MNKFSKLAVKIAGLTSAFMATVTLASAQAFGTSTAAGHVTQLSGDVALIIGAVIVSILGLLAALLGLGFGVNRFRKYVTGKKF